MRYFEVPQLVQYFLTAGLSVQYEYIRVELASHACKVGHLKQIIVTLKMNIFSEILQLPF